MPSSGRPAALGDPKATFFHLQTELDLAYHGWVHRPGEFLSVLDNASDLKECAKLTGANATTLGAMLSRAVVALPEGNVKGYTADPQKDVLRQTTVAVESGAGFAAYLGEFNNPWFVRYPDEFVAENPDAWMRDAEGNRVELTRSTHGGNEVIPVPAVDDPTLLSLASDLIRAAVPAFLESGLVAQWVVGTEESYPELFGLPASDFRPAFLKHFAEWQERWLGGSRLEVDTIRELRLENPDLILWSRFREQAMADRAAHYMQAFLEADTSHPVFYPTHGNLFLRNVRLALAQPPSLMAAATDGMEMGHITIDDDDERLNPLVNAHFGAFGKPLINPRLANKTLDNQAKGGGRSFTPQMLRRLVYESLGQGVWHIGPIHWTSILHDGEWAIKDTPAEAECRKVFQEINEAAWLLDGMARLQPQIGLFVADDTWLQSWNPRWTGLFQDALSAHWNISVVDDDVVDESLVSRTPLLISVDNASIAPDTLAGMQKYLDAGGHLLVVGTFGESIGVNQDGETAVAATLRHANVFVADFPGSLPKRRLTNEVHNGNGAAVFHADYVPVDLEKLAQHIERELPSVVAAPVRITGEHDGDVNAFVLTDRGSLLAVVINNADSPRSVNIATAPQLTTGIESWNCTDGVGREPLSDSSSCRVDLEQFGTRLLWIHPSVDESETDAAVAEALRAVNEWEPNGYDVEAVRYAADLLQSGSGLHHAKKFSLARAILQTVAVRSSVTVGGDGSHTVTTEVVDSSGGPVAGAEVTMRITPGAPGRIALEEVSDGRHGVTIKRDDLPHFYNAQEQEYQPVRGPVRVVITVAAANGRQGGCIVNMDL